MRFVLIKGIISGTKVPFPTNDSKACDLGIKCPVSVGDSNVVSLSIPVLSIYPALSLYVKVEIIADDSGHDYVCLQFPVTIQGSSQRRKLVGWEKGKLFEILN